jgi:TatD DNase family protein
MIDSHCHLAGEEFVADLDKVFARARQAGVDRLLVIVAAEDDAEWARATALAVRDSGIDLAVGVHPHHAHLFAADPQQAARVVASRLDGHPAARAVGEIGLDYHYDFSPRDVQQAVFRAQLALAQARGLPVAIHTREAEADTLALIHEAQRAGPLRGIFHCFTGDAAAATRALATGFSLSFAGILTFPRAGDLREALRATPIERVLLETDAPYLAPVPHRGSRNEPAFVAVTAGVAARELGLSQDALTAQVVANFESLVGPRRR